MLSASTWKELAENADSIDQAEADADRAAVAAASSPSMHDAISAAVDHNDLEAKEAKDAIASYTAQEAELDALLRAEEQDSEDSEGPSPESDTDDEFDVFDRELRPEIDVQVIKVSPQADKTTCTEVRTLQIVQDVEFKIVEGKPDVPSYGYHVADGGVV